MYLLTVADVAKAIINQLIIAGTVASNMVFFLPKTFTMSAQIMEPIAAPNVSKDATQEASFAVKRTEYFSSFPCINIGKDGDDQPKN